MTNETIKKVNALKLWFLQQMQRISWTTHITNETVLKQSCQVRQLLNTIKNRQLQFFGHITRQENLVQTSITGHINGKPARGHQRYNYLDQLKTYTKLNTEDCCILSKIQENGKTFALMLPRPGSGMALNDDDKDKIYYSYKKLLKLKFEKIFIVLRTKLSKTNYFFENI